MTGGLKNPQWTGPVSRRAEVLIGFLALVVLLNSSVLFWGFHRLRQLAEAMQSTVMISIAAGAGAETRADAAASNRSQLMRVELFNDLACRYCRRSAPVIDSLRRMFPDSVRWVYRYLPNVHDALSMRSAMAAACTGDSNGAWRLYSIASRAADWSYEALERSLARMGLSLDAIGNCMNADSTRQEVWADVFRAAATGKTGTPTVVVGGLAVAGKLRVDPLATLIRARLTQLRTRRDGKGS